MMDLWKEADTGGEFIRNHAQPGGVVNGPIGPMASVPMAKDKLG